MVLDKLHSIFLFFDWPKRAEVLQTITSKEHPKGSNRKPLTDLCKTRWAARHDSYSHFYTSYMYIVKALEVIVFGFHTKEYDFESKGKWDPKAKSEARSLLAAITSFDFIVSFLILYQYLSHLDSITVKLQSSSLDIMKAYELSSGVIATYQSLRDENETNFAPIYDQAVRMAKAVGVEPSMPRVSSGRQQHRANAPAESADKFYRINVALPFLDHIIGEMTARFTEESHACSAIIQLVPGLMNETHKSRELTETAKIYTDDLPSPEVLQQELIR